MSSRLFERPPRSLEFPPGPLAGASVVMFHNERDDLFHGYAECRIAKGVEYHHSGVVEVVVPALDVVTGSGRHFCVCSLPLPDPLLDSYYEAGEALSALRALLGVPPASWSELAALRLEAERVGAFEVPSDLEGFRSGTLDLLEEVRASARAVLLAADPEPDVFLRVAGRWFGSDSKFGRFDWPFSGVEDAVEETLRRLQRRRYPSSRTDVLTEDVLREWSGLVVSGSSPAEASAEVVRGYSLESHRPVRDAYAEPANRSLSRLAEALCVLEQGVEAVARLGVGLEHVVVVVHDFRQHLAERPRVLAEAFGRYPSGIVPGEEDSRWLVLPRLVEHDLRASLEVPPYSDRPSKVFQVLGEAKVPLDRLPAAVEVAWRLWLENRLDDSPFTFKPKDPPPLSYLSGAFTAAQGMV